MYAVIFLIKISLHKPLNLQSECSHFMAAPVFMTGRYLNHIDNDNYQLIMVHNYELDLFGCKDGSSLFDFSFW